MKGSGAAWLGLWARGEKNGDEEKKEKRKTYLFELLDHFAVAFPRNYQATLASPISQQSESLAPKFVRANRSASGIQLLGVDTFGRASRWYFRKLAVGALPNTP